MRRWTRPVAATAALLLAFGLTFWYAGYVLQPARRTGAPVTVAIPNGADARTIGQRLKDAGLIRSVLAFQFMARLLGESRQMKAGDYELPTNLGVIQLIDRLVTGDAVAQWVTIPEGRTLSEVAQVLAGRKLVSSSAFLRAASRPPAAYGLPFRSARASVDGYLMPDTYKLPKRLSAPQLVRVLVRNWVTKVYEPNRKRFSASDLPPDKVLVVASLIEREARVPEDRPLISSVIRNRLRRKMPLQIDATVLYALGQHKEVVTFADLKVASPFNTYRRKGLPPGPICNPGLDAVKAALQPAPTEYLYYVARPDGRHIFTRTAAEHAAAIAKVRALRKSTQVAATTAGVGG